jgi:3-hydroxybutyryl-CoA dehydratase
MNSYRWEDLQEGLSHEFSVEITSMMMDTFRELSGDTNPLHMDEAFARSAGQPSIVVFGLLSAAMYSRLVGVYLPGRYALLQGIDVDFVKPAFAGDVLNVSGLISYRNEAYRRLELSARITTPGGQMISRAKIKVGVHEH